MDNIGIEYQELRVGNWVYSTYEKQEYQITGFDIQALHEGMDSYVFDPIKVSEDVLLRLGFEKLDDTHYSIRGMKIWKCNEMFICDKTGTILETVHWLQNYYYFKTKFELELKTIEE